MTNVRALACPDDLQRVQEVLEEHTLTGLHDIRVATCTTPQCARCKRQHTFLVRVTRMRYAPYDVIGLKVRWIDPALRPDVLAATLNQTRCSAAFASHQQLYTFTTRGAKTGRIATRASMPMGAWPANSDWLYVVDKLSVHRHTVQLHGYKYPSERKLPGSDRRAYFISELVHRMWGRSTSAPEYQPHERNIQVVHTAHGTLALHLDRKPGSAEPFSHRHREVILQGMFATERWVVRSLGTSHTRGYNATIYWNVNGTGHVATQRCLLDLRSRELVFAPVSRQRMSDCPRCLTTDPEDHDKVQPESWHNGYLQPVVVHDVRKLRCKNCQEVFDWPDS